MASNCFDKLLNPFPSNCSMRNVFRVAVLLIAVMLTIFPNTWQNPKLKFLTHLMKKYQWYRHWRNSIELFSCHNLSSDVWEFAFKRNNWCAPIIPYNQLSSSLKSVCHGPPHWSDSAKEHQRLYLDRSPRDWGSLACLV